MIPAILATAKEKAMSASILAEMEETRVVLTKRIREAKAIPFRTP
jgi:hypothetical protein